MKALLFTIGSLFIAVGIFRISNPKAFTQLSSGPHALSSDASPAVLVVDPVSAKRSEMTGYASVLVGALFLIGAVYWRKMDLTKSLDDL